MASRCVVLNEFRVGEPSPGFKQPVSPKELVPAHDPRIGARWLRLRGTCVVPRPSSQCWPHPAGMDLRTARGHPPRSRRDTTRTCRGGVESTSGNDSRGTHKGSSPALASWTLPVFGTLIRSEHRLDRSIGANRDKFVGRPIVPEGISVVSDECLYGLTRRP